VPHEVGQISRLGGRKGLNKHAVHDANACNADTTSRKGPTGSQ